MIVNTTDTSWQTEFVAHVAPVVDRWARARFKNYRREKRAELVQNSICLAFQYYASLAKRGRTQLVSASALARRAVQHTKAGRRFGSSQAKRDALAHLGTNEEVRKLADNAFSTIGQNVHWSSAIIDPKYANPSDLATVRIDATTWIDSMSPKLRAIAKALASGEATMDVAERFGLSWGRISQLRRELVTSWERFQSQAIALQASA